MIPDYARIRQLETELGIMPLTPWPPVHVASTRVMVARRQDSWDRIERDAKRLAALGTMLTIIENRLASLEGK